MTTAVTDPVVLGGTTELHCQSVVLGAGPGGYSAAFRATDLGLDTILVERYPVLGGVCLNVGCIPSKALLHATAVIESARMMAGHGIDFGSPRIDREKLRAWKDGIVAQLTRGLSGLARQRKLRVVHGVGTFRSAYTLQVQTETGQLLITFEHAIIAAGSQPIALPAFPNHDRRLLDSTTALQLNDIPSRMLVVGGGIIGLEMAAIYNALGSKITLLELSGDLLIGCDRDLVMPLKRRILDQYQNVFVDTELRSIMPGEHGLVVTFEAGDTLSEDCFDAVLVAVGRSPNGHAIAATAAGVAVDAIGFIATDQKQRTNVRHIFAIGDIVGAPMLAHKAAHQGKIAAEVIAGHKTRFEALTIPSVAYTHPEVAWVGVTETEATARGLTVDKAIFPWAASGRAVTIGAEDGLTKLLFEPNTGRLIGAGIVGPHAGDLISEAVLAIEMGADSFDIGLSIHPHPTLSETLAMAAEVVNGTITDLYVPRKP